MFDEELQDGFELNDDLDEEPLDVPEGVEDAEPGEEEDPDNKFH